MLHEDMLHEDMLRKVPRDFFILFINHLRSIFQCTEEFFITPLTTSLLNMFSCTLRTLREIPVK